MPFYKEKGKANPICELKLKMSSFLELQQWLLSKGQQTKTASSHLTVLAEVRD